MNIVYKVRRKIQWGTPIEVSPSGSILQTVVTTQAPVIPTPIPVVEPTRPTTPPPPPPPATFPIVNSVPAGSKNGHKIEKVRDLLDSERDVLRGEFFRKNGITNEDDCVRLLDDRMGIQVAIFQVTGFFTYLHAEVAKGKIVLNDMPAYLRHLSSMRALYARYNSPKYIAMRQNILTQGSAQSIIQVS